MKVSAARRLIRLLSVALLALAVPAPSPSYAAPTVQGDGAPAGTIETAHRSRPVAPGVTLTSFDRIDQRGWLRADALSADLTGGVTVDYLHPGRVTAVEPLSVQANRQRAVAAVNGDFFDINNSGAPIGVGIQNGALVKSPSPGWNHAVGIDATGVGRVLDVFFEGTVSLPAGATTLHQLNSAQLPPDGIGAYTSLWGGYSRARGVTGATRVAEVTVVAGRVTAVGDQPGAGPIEAGTTVLVGREAGADRLLALAVGDAVSVDYQPRTSDGSRLRAAIGGNARLLVGGEIAAEATDDVTAHPRTAVGFSADGRRMYLLSIDGRQADSRGATMRELAVMMRELGAVNALNLDGGGSSTLLAREPGTAAVQIENDPSEGGERLVPNGLALFAPAGSGRLTGFWVEPVTDPVRAPGTGPMPGGRPDRVFPGLTRRLVARGHDETYGPVAADPRWRVSSLTHGYVAPGAGGEAAFRALLPGPVTVAAVGAGAARGELALTVLGPLRRIDATTDRVTIVDPARPGRFGIVGFDATGTSAPIEAGDVRLDYDRALLDVAPAPDGGFTATARQPSGSGLITVRVGTAVTVVPYSIGLSEHGFASFDDAGSWTFGSARGTGSVTPVPDGHTGHGLRISYDFTQSTGTRTAYAYPPAPIQLDGQPLALGAWVYAHGKGEWTAFTITDANNQTYSLYGPYLTWTGWRYLEMTVPSTVAYPIRVNRFYTIETAADRQYTGEVLIDDFVARVAPSVTVPAEPPVRAPFVVTDGTVAGAPWRFAVMSDAQFVAADPDSPLVAAARRTLREIRAARPDFLMIVGDFVDTAYEADFDLARRVLTEEIGDALPWYYIPGNHEIMGAGSIANFTAEFGAPYRSFDHKGTRFVTLDSATGTLRGGGFEQLLMLRERLAEARTNPAVTSVVVLHHHPPRDPTPAKGSQLGDRKEAALVEQWLAEFQSTTGKGAAFIGAHVGAFHASTVDGVPYLINGNSGKTPSTTVDNGGFTGWTMLGIDPAARQGWLRAEIRPHVDALRLTAPSTVVAGGTATVTALVEQGDRTVPVAYPVSADWSGSLNLHVGDRHGVRPWHVARLDPVTGELVALRAGTVQVAVTVNGVTARATVEVTAVQRAAA